MPSPTCGPDGWRVAAWCTWAKASVLPRSPERVLAALLGCWGALVLWRYVVDQHDRAEAGLFLGDNVVAAAVAGVLVFGACAALGHALVSRFHPLEDLSLRLLTALGLGTGAVG